MITYIKYENAIQNNVILQLQKKLCGMSLKIVLQFTCTMSQCLDTDRLIDFEGGNM